MKNPCKRLMSIILCLTLTLSMATSIVALAQHEPSADDELGPSAPIASTAADYGAAPKPPEEPAEPAEPAPAAAGPDATNAAHGLNICRSQM